MLKTSPLRLVLSNTVPKGVLILHPNEGADLGMITKQHFARLGTGIDARSFLSGEGGTVEQVVFDLQNECPLGELRINPSLGDEIEKGDRIIVFYDGARAFIHAIA